MIRRPDLVEELENRYKREEYSKLTYEDKLGIFLELRAQASAPKPHLCGRLAPPDPAQDRNRLRLPRTRQAQSKQGRMREADRFPSSSRFRHPLHERLKFGELRLELGHQIPLRLWVGDQHLDR